MKKTTAELIETINKANDLEMLLIYARKEMDKIKEKHPGYYFPCKPVAPKSLIDDLNIKTSEAKTVLALLNFCFSQLDQAIKYESEFCVNSSGLITIPEIQKEWLKNGKWNEQKQEAPPPCEISEEFKKSHNL